MRRLLDAGELACDLDPYTKLQAVCPVPLIAPSARRSPCATSAASGDVPPGRAHRPRHRGGLPPAGGARGDLPLPAADLGPGASAHPADRRAHVPGADGTAVTTCYDWPSNGRVTLTTGRAVPDGVDGHQHARHRGRSGARGLPAVPPGDRPQHRRHHPQLPPIALAAVIRRRASRPCRGARGPGTPQRRLRCRGGAPGSRARRSSQSRVLISPDAPARRTSSIRVW